MSENSNTFLHTKIDALAAYVASFTEGPESALAQLRGKHDPESVKRHLAILIDASRFEEAARLVDQLPPDSAWCDKAIFVFACSGSMNRAKELVAWAKTQADPTAWHRCVYSCVEGAYRSALKRHEGQGSVRPDLLASSETSALAELVEVAQPIIRLVDAKERVDNEMESLVVQYVLHAESLLRHRPSVERLSRWLLPRKPISLIIPRLMLSRSIALDESVVPRLRLEHVGDFEAGLLASLLEGELQGRHAQAFKEAIQLAPIATDNEHKRELCRVFLQLGQFGGVDSLRMVESEATKLLKSDDALLKHIQATVLLAEEKPQEAGAILDQIRDDKDPQWLQAYSNYLVHTGKAGEAVEYMEAAAKLLPHPELLRSLAMLAYKSGKLGQAKDALERLLSLNSDDKSAVHNLSLVYLQLEEWMSAAQQLKVLHQLEPGNPLHRLNAANALARAGDLDGSLREYDAACDTPEAPLEAYLGRAGLLKTMGKPYKAFDTLNTLRQRFWDSPEFVGVFLDISFMAEKEEEGHQALLQLRRLQELGKAAPDILQQKSLDDLMQHMRHHNENVEMLNRNVLQGKLPWLMCDAFLGTPSYASWRTRTQEFLWRAEDPIFQAQTCIYSTNSFSVRNRNGTGVIAELTCCPSNTSIVIDLSALITLQRLNLLTEAVNYFGRVIYPSSYLTLRLHEAGRLFVHQPSRKHAMEAIRDAVDSRRIEVMHLPAADEETPFVNEHTLPEDSSNYYRLRDLLHVLSEAGMLDQHEKQRMEAVSQKPSGVNDEHPKPLITTAIRIEISTLETLSQIRVLDPILRGFKVQIDSLGYQRMINELSGFANQERLADWNASLWEWIRKEPRMVQAIHTSPPEWEGKHLGIGQEESLSSAFLSLQERIPLFADDRCCQMYVLNQRSQESHAAFGTDCVIEALAEQGAITWDVAADCVLQLFTWRYRFLRCSPKVLTTIARRYGHSLPGDQLRRIALYVHDSIRDPGLFGGFEPTVPPTTMTSRFYQAWAGTAAEAIAAVWLDDKGFSEEQAIIFTQWAMQELLPSVPRSMGPAARVLAELTPKMVLSRLLLKLCVTDKYKVANRCIHVAGAALGLTPEETEQRVLEVIDEI